MTWAAPMTAVSGNVLTAGQFNTYVRNNLNECAPAKITAKGRYVVPNGTNVLTERRIVSAIDTNTINFPQGSTLEWMDGGGPSVSCVTGTSALVFVGGHMANETADRASGIGYELTGTTNRGLDFTSASNKFIILTDGLNASSGTSNAVRGSLVSLEEGLTPGTNTFTLKYRRHTSGTCYYTLREIIVMAL